MPLKHKTISLIVLVGLFLIACGFFLPFDMSPRGMRLICGNRGTNFESNGERIYFTGTNEQGEFISYTGKPASGSMMGDILSCVSCHGPDGRGGQHMMHMLWMDASDVRYKTLAAEDGEHAGEGHGEEYDLENLRKAVVLGLHSDGDVLRQDMPRWQINDEDLNDLFDFLKTLP